METGKMNTRMVPEFRVGQPLIRIGLLSVEALVGLTALAGGIALILGAIMPQTVTAVSPPDEYLAGTPFSSYLVPGIVLAVVVGGLHSGAFVLELRRNRLHIIAAATASFALLIWIFVQMIVIPFSFLQAAYFAAGLAELGLVLLSLDVLRLAPNHPERREHRSDVRPGQLAGDDRVFR